jgi:hypothetical protein
VFLYASALKSILCMHVQFTSHTNVSLVVGHKENEDYLVRQTSIVGTQTTGHQYDMTM